MQIREVMTQNVHTISPDSTLRDAAMEMSKIDAGILPVSDGNRLIGMITDRDIAIRGIGHGLGPDARVGDVMTHDVRYCFDDQDLEDVSDNMGDIQVRRLPVVDRNKRLVGIVSLGDLATSTSGALPAAEALRGVARPGGAHQV